ncbi:MAG: TIGR00725 family protein, partial [Calditrichaeota bacterium]
GIKEDSEIYQKARKLGKALIDHGFRILNGGMTGIMEAVCRGARESEKYYDGLVIGILPGFDPDFSNKYLDVAIATGLDTYRNGIVANSDAVIAIGGQAGTLSEMAFAWTFKRMLLAYDVPGWSGKLAGQKLDNRDRIGWEEDRIFKVSDETEAIELIKTHIHRYKERHKSIGSLMEQYNYRL